MPRCIRMPFILLARPEIAVNCWYKHDLASGVIHAVAVQLYEVMGVEQGMMEFLTERSTIDYETAKFGKLPTEEGKLDSAIAEMQMRSFPLGLFEDRIEAAIRQLRPQDISESMAVVIRQDGGISTNDMLHTVTALVKTPDGRERAIVDSEDEAWLSEQIQILGEESVIH